jgi:hypothetical protein
VRCCHRKLHHHLHSLQYADFRGAWTNLHQRQNHIC